MQVILVIFSISVLILVHELGHFFAARLFKVRVDEFGIGFPPKIFSKKRGETEYSINALPFGGFVRMRGEDGGSSQETDPRNFSSQKAWKRAVILLGGVATHVILGWILLSVVSFVGIPFHPVVQGVAADSPAELAGIEEGDIIISAETGERKITAPMTVEEFSAFVYSSRNEEIVLSAKRGTKEISVSATARENPPEGEGALGVYLFEMGTAPAPLFESVARGASQTLEVSTLIGEAFFSIVSKIFSEPDVIKNIAGPIGIVSFASQASSVNMIYFLQLLAIISLNLVILNLLPFPALDGGRVLLLAVEKIKGSPVPVKIQMAINAGGFILLIILMVLVTIQDVTRLFS